MKAVHHINGDLTDNRPENLSVDEPAWTAPQASLPIQSSEHYLGVSEALREVKRFERQVVDFFAPLKKSARAAWQGLVDRENAVLAPSKAWEVQAKHALAAYDEAQERRRREEQRRLEAEARRQEEERRLAAAVQLETEGLAQRDQAKLAEAEQIIAAPVVIHPVVVEKATPKAEGISYRDVWDARVVNLAALIQHVAQHPDLTGLLEPKMSALRDLARSAKSNLGLPGVEAFSTRVVAAR